MLAPARFLTKGLGGWGTRRPRLESARPACLEGPSRRRPSCAVLAAATAAQQPISTPRPHVPIAALTCAPGRRPGGPPRWRQRRGPASSSNLGCRWRRLADWLGEAACGACPCAAMASDARGCACLNVAKRDNLRLFGIVCGEARVSLKRLLGAFGVHSLVTPARGAQM